MKANKFVKEHGFQYTRNLVRDYPNHTHVTDDGRMFINENTCVSHIKVQLNELVKMDDLKRLVESHELVERLGGIETMRIMQKQMVLNSLKDGMNISFDGEFVGTFSFDQLEQAILDVESCQ